VIAIIAILAAMLLPALTRARSSARKSVCQSQLRQLAFGHMFYAEDHEGWFPVVYWVSSAAIKLDNKEDLLPFYGGSEEMFRCPSARYLGTAEQYDVGYFRTSEGLRLTSYRVLASRSDHDPGAGFFFGHWTLNAALPHSPADPTCAPCPNLNWPEKSMSDPDGGRQNVYMQSASRQPLAFDGRSALGPGWTLYSSSEQQLNNHADLDGLNVVFLDGHTQWGMQSNAVNRVNLYGSSGGWMRW